MPVRRPKKRKRLCTFGAQPQMTHLSKVNGVPSKLLCVRFRFRGFGLARSSGLTWNWRRRKRGGNRGIPQGDARSRSQPKGIVFALSTSKSDGLCPYSSLFPVSGHRLGPIHEHSFQVHLLVQRAVRPDSFGNSRVISHFEPMSPSFGRS